MSGIRTLALAGSVVLGIATAEPLLAAYGAADIDRAAQFANPRPRGLLRRIASNRFAGRDNDTPESAAVQELLIDALRTVSTEIPGVEGFRQPFTESGENGTNLLGVIVGRELPNEYVIVGAHYDHLGRDCDRATPDDDICNGATDNAAGAAAVIAVGRGLRALPVPPRRSVVLALWDAEEDGLLGSLYYVNHPPVPLASTRAYVNLDILGANLLPSTRNISFAVGAETGGALLREMTDAAIAASDLGTRQFSFIFGQRRSDYANFVDAGVPTTFFSDSTGACYHTSGDSLRQVDIHKLKAQSQIAFRLTVALAETDTPPAYVPPDPALANYTDAVTLLAVLEQGLIDVDVFPPRVRTQLLQRKDQIAAIVSDGPTEFDDDDIVTVLATAVESINALTDLECGSVPPR